MLGIAFHPLSLISLMVDRERFSVVTVLKTFSNEIQENLEKLFASPLPNGMRKLLLVEDVATLRKIAARFPEQKVRIVVFDNYSNLKPVAGIIADADKENSAKMLAVRPGAINPALLKMRASVLEDYRSNFDGDVKAVEIAQRDGLLANTLKDASEAFRITAIKYLLGISSFASLKRVGRQDKSKYLQVQQYVESDAGSALLFAYMDVAIYGTNDKSAALFAEADLEDLRLALSLVQPEPDMQFGYEIPDKLRVARGI